VLELTNSKSHTNKIIFEKERLFALSLFKGVATT